MPLPPFARRPVFWAIFATFLVAAWLRLDGLGQPSLWLDEILTVERTAAALDASWWNWLSGFDFDNEIGPVFYASEAIAGADSGVEWRVRLPAALAGLATLLIVALAARGFDTRTAPGRGMALAAAALIALSPAHVVFSREGRPYSLLMLGVALLLAITARPGGDRRAWPLLLVATLGLAATSAVAGAALAVTLAVGLTRLPGVPKRQAREGSRTVVAAGLGLATLAGLYFGSGRYTAGGRFDATSGVTLPWSGTAFDRLLASHTTAGLDATATANWRSWVFLGIALLGAAVLARHRRGLLVGALAFGAPLVTLLALGAIGHWYSVRYTAVTLPAFLLCVAAGVVAVAQFAGGMAPRKHRGAARGAIGTLLVAVLSLPGWGAARSEPHRKIDWRQMADEIRSVEGAEIPVVTTNDWSARCLRHYLDRSPGRFTIVSAEGDLNRLESELSGATGPALVVSAGYHPDPAPAVRARGLPRLLTVGDDEGVLTAWPDLPTLVEFLSAAGFDSPQHSSTTAWARRLGAELPIEFDGREADLLGTGWADAEVDPDDRSFRWTVAATATIALPVRAGRDTATLTLRAWEVAAAPTLAMTVAGDGVELETLDVGPDWAEYTIRLEPRATDTLRTVRFTTEVGQTDRAANPATSGETRQLGIAFDRLNVAGAEVAAPDVASPDAAERPSGVILIVIDTLRADRLQAYGGDGSVMPHLDRWTRDAAVYPRSWSSSSWTLPSFASLLTGLDPSRHGADAWFRDDGELEYRTLRGDRPTLAETLSAAGVRTGAIVNNPWLRPKSTLDRGFDDYDYATSDNRDHRRADEVFDLAIRWLSEVEPGTPYLLVVHVLDPHMNYDPPVATRGRFTSNLPGGNTWSTPIGELPRLREGPVTDDERRFVAAAYDEELAAVDLALGEFLATTRKPLVILTADHGEELWDHGGFEHGHAMWDEVVRVPMVVRGPGVEPGRHSTAVSSPDVAATILEALGVAPTGRLDGRSLWPELTRGATPAARVLPIDGTLYGERERSIVAWPWKLVNDGGDLRLYNLTLDSPESRNVAADNTEVVTELAARIGASSEQSGEQSPGEGLEPDAETLRALRSLGYVD